MMKHRLDPDRLANELAAARALIEGHENMQRLLDLAADEADRRMQSSQRSVVLAVRVATAMGVLACMSLAVAYGAVRTSMRPAPPPEVLVVDRAGGVVQPLVSLAEFQMKPEEASIRRIVNTFVLAREGYSYEQADTHYYTTAAFLSPPLQAQWGQMWDVSNPDSPPRKYKRERRIRVKVGAITILRNGLGNAIGARASFNRTEVVNDVPEPPTDWIATLSFHWVNQPTNERDRRINDLGLEVTDYAADRDLGSAKSAPAPAQPVRQAAQSVAAPVAMVSPTHTQEAAP
jgi:type IV secretion system protein VirB8